MTIKHKELLSLRNRSSKNPSRRTQVVPLNDDAWYKASLLLYLTSGFRQMRGGLTLEGKTRVTLTYAPAPTSANIGVTVYHAVIVSQAGTYFLATNPVPLSFVK